MTRIPSGHRQDGFILIVVLGAVLILSALLFGFNQTARTRLNTADSFHRMEQVANGARTGLQIALAAIRDTDDLGTDSRFAGLLTGENAFPVEDAQCSLTVIDESGLLNVNRLKNPDGQIDRRSIDRLLRLIDLLNARQKDQSKRIGYGVVSCIIDWIDSDDEVTHLPFVQRENTGAESSYYQSLSPPGRCRNQPLDTVDDLFGVNGVTPEVLDRLRPYLTCAGDGKININTAPDLVVQSLSEQIDDAMAQMILKQRKLRPFESLAQLRSMPGMTDNVYRGIQSQIVVRPTERFYRVRSQARTADRQCLVEALLQRNTQAGTVDIVLYREM
ncbi:MAG TPA: type II secretion system minor pseudopilin GspK [Sedimentisphaerales bacterium]|jgi:general secretion pathway protein K|nr:type II secretion system minor pseudopilin GspK [Sedimentisphaerales bacterium]HNU29447.1 type II secretion system minor pseudopilin GspK [Sedimentisphaerales bacterium]